MTTLGKRTTAREALRGTDLKGHFAIVTGASSGIGVETARALATAGADVMLAVRNVEAGEKTKAQLTSELPAGAGPLSVARLDLNDLASVREFVKTYLASTRPLDLLINNAGIMAPPLGFTAQGYEQQMGTNHLGHFLLTQGLRERLEKSAAARIVNVSSDLHRRGKADSVLATLDTDRKYASRKYSGFGAYGDSKLANVLFARGLAKRLPKNVLAFSLHPGVIPTNLSRAMFGNSVFKLMRCCSRTSGQAAYDHLRSRRPRAREGHSRARTLSDCHKASHAARRAR